MVTPSSDDGVAVAWQGPTRRSSAPCCHWLQTDTAPRGEMIAKVGHKGLRNMDLIQKVCLGLVRERPKIKVLKNIWLDNTSKLNLCYELPCTVVHLAGKCLLITSQG